MPRGTCKSPESQKRFRVYCARSIYPERLSVGNSDSRSLRGVCSSPPGYRDRHGLFECEGPPVGGRGGVSVSPSGSFRAAMYTARRERGSPCELKVLKVPPRRIANCFVASSPGLTTAPNWKYRDSSRTVRHETRL